MLPKIQSRRQPVYNISCILSSGILTTLQTMAGPDAYAQWVQMNVSNYAKDTLNIENAKLDWYCFPSHTSISCAYQEVKLQGQILS
jgi:hypothetical protein